MIKQAYERIKNFIGRNFTVIKVLFAFSVFTFVAYEIGQIFKKLDWAHVGASLMARTPLEIIIMLVGGLIAVAPMLGYDFMIVRFLPENYTVPYVVRSGWITNTFTNIAGFGGVLGATLRANFYNKNATKKQVLYAISKIALFLLAGLSIYCWVALLMMFGLGIGHHFHNYAVWLLGGGLYFPVLFCVTKFKDNAFFGDLTLKREAGLIATSTCEWGLAALFFLLIGAILHPHVHLAAVFPLYIIAEVVGIISLVPGGLGSFDVFMLIGLTALHVPSAVAVAWLLLFRLFYYIVPFLVGLVFFAHDLGHRVNEHFNGLPRALLHKGAHFLVTAFMYFSAIFMLLEAAVPNFTLSNGLLMKLDTYTFLFLNQISSIIFAFMLLGMARGIQNKVKKAFWPTLVILAVGIINTLIHAYTLSLAIFLAVVFLAVVLSRHELYREQLQYSLAEVVVDTAIVVGIALLYVVVGIINAPSTLIHHHHPHYVPPLLLFPAQRVWLYGFIGIIIATVILVAIMNYLASGTNPFQRFEYDEARIKRVISTYGGNEVSHLAFLQDKHLYYYTANGEDKLFFMYQLKADKLMIMGEPVGDQSYLEDAISALITAADRYGYQLVFYEINAQLTLLLHEYGYDFIKTGEEGTVDLPSFTLAGKKQRAQRALMHKFEREGYTFTMEPAPVFDQLMAEMRAVSDSWLDGQVEKGFSLGFFDPHYINEAPVALVRARDDTLVAFATLMPMDDGTLSVDLMRHSKDAPSGIMDMIFISLFQYGQEHDYQRFNMGMAPLSNVGESKFSFLEEKAAHFIYEYGYKLYGFQGLRAYKNKYVTQWRPKYTSYRKRSSVAITMLQLIAVVNRKRLQQGDRAPRTILVPKFLQR